MEQGASKELVVVSGEERRSELGLLAAACRELTLVAALLPSSRSGHIDLHETWSHGEGDRGFHRTGLAKVSVCRTEHQAGTSASPGVIFASVISHFCGSKCTRV